jgi:hypothetical protein
LLTQTSIEVTKMDFSEALSEWNHPDHFNPQKAQTTNDLIQNRLILIQNDAETLLLASGKTQMELNAMSLEQNFLTALSIYTQNNTNFKN